MKAVYVGGFGNGKKCSERVVRYLETYYDQVSYFTFSYAMDHIGEVHAALDEADAVTHSAGALVVAGSTPNRVISFNPPLPVPIGKFIGRTVKKTRHMHRRYGRAYSPGAVGVYDRSSLAEMLAHPLGNISRLRGISRFNAVEEAAKAAKLGVPCTLIYTYGDEFFQLTEEYESMARAAGVRVLRLSGAHDELILRPEAMLVAALFDDLGKPSSTGQAPPQ